MENPTDRTMSCVQELYGKVKRPLRLSILLDVSTFMSITLQGGNVRWKYVSQALEQLPEYLEDSANVTLTCFAQQLYERGGAGINCASEGPWPAGLMGDARGDIMEYWGYSMLKTDDAEFYEAFNDTYRMVYNEMVDDVDNEFKHVMLVITHPDNREGDDETLADLLSMEEELLELVGMALNPGDNVPVFSLHYYGDPSHVTSDTLEQIADRTNGEYSLAKADTLADSLKEMMYYF